MRVAICFNSLGTLAALTLPMPREPSIPAPPARLVGYVSVTPDGTLTPERPSNSGPYTAVFTVANTDPGPGSEHEDFNLICSSSANVTCTDVSPPFVSLAPNQSAPVTVTYTVGGPGSGEVSLTAMSDVDPEWDEGYYVVPVAPVPPPTNWDIGPLNAEHQIVARCAAACFAATYAQSTVPYFSMDTPRNVTLVYNGDRLWPKPFIHLNVQKPSGSTPDTVLLQVKKAGAFQTFVNGETTLKFAGAASGWQRIGGQLRDSTWATGMSDVDLIVTWKYAGGSSTVQTWSTKLLVVNEGNSPIAQGWTLAGIQRAYVQADGSLLVTEGDGSAVFFRKGGSTFASPAGEFSTIVVNGSGWKRLYPDSTKVFFSSAGRMTDVYDRFGNHATVGYDGSNRVVSVTDPAGLALILTYGTNGLSSIRDNIAPFRYTNVTVPANRTLTAIQDPDGVNTTFQYDANLRLWKITDRRGNTTTLAYQTINGKVTGKLATITAPAVSIYSGGTATPVVTYSPWHTVGVPYTLTAASPAPVIRPDTVYGRVTDPGGHLTRFTVGHWGQPVAAIDPAGDTTRITYEGNGLPIRTVFSADPTAVDTAAYNVNGLPTYVRPAAAPATTIGYNPVWVTRPDSIVTSGLPKQRFYIGTAGRVDSMVIGSKVKYTYDTQGRVRSVADALGTVVRRLGYTGTNGNQSADTIPNVRVGTYGYDAYGRPTTVAATGVATSTTYYDVVNRADSVRDGVNPVATRLAYDAGSNVLSVTDPKGQVYGFAYNVLGWLTARTDPTAHADTLKYDIDGQMREWKNRRGQVTRYAFDVLHRPTGKGGANTDSTALGYSANRRTLMALRRIGGSVTVTDSLYLSMLGVVDKAVTNFGTFTRTRQYGYTAAGVLDSVWVAPYTGNTFLGRKYFITAATGALAEIRFGGKTTAHYVDANLRDTLNIYTGQDSIRRTTLAWGPAAGMHSPNPTFNVLGRSLEYGTAGRIRHQFTEAIPIQYSRIWSYDGLGRVARDTGGNIGYDECTYDPYRGWVCPNFLTDSVRSFGYDAVGNVLRDSVYRVWNGTTAVQTGTYGSGNRISAFGSCTYGADLDGNVTSRTCGGEAVTLWWSSENRLDSLAVNGVKTRFFYDGFGRLVKRDANGTIHYFWWDGNNVFAELDASGAKLVEYSYYGMDAPHALATADSTVYFMHRDGLGNVIGLVDDTGAVIQRYGGFSGYGLWGEWSSGWSPGPLPGGGQNRALFKGALWLGDAGLDFYYMRARWYEPKTGRFLSEDPIGLAGGINLYRYAGNDPVNKADPRGLCTGSLAPVCMAGAAGAIYGAYIGWTTYDEVTSRGNRTFLGRANAVLGGAVLGGVYAAGAAALFELALTNPVQIPEAVVLSGGLLIAGDKAIETYVDLVVAAERGLNMDGGDSVIRCWSTGAEVTADYHGPGAGTTTLFECTDGSRIWIRTS
jgi:RHS repeat-associated protein